MKIFEKFLNKLALDERISDGIFDPLKNEHLDVFQEYIEKLGATYDEAVDVRNHLIEGKYPERQAYNANGILVTFPTPEYKQRAIKRGTHFENNPKKLAPNVSFDDKGPTKDKVADDKPTKPEPEVEEPEVKKEPVEDKPEVDVTPPEPPKPSLPEPTTALPVLVLPPGELKKREDAIVKQAQEEYIEKILTMESTKVRYSLKEAQTNGFYNKGIRWYDPEGNYVGILCYEQSDNSCYIIG